jgi:hypothetical protein
MNSSTARRALLNHGELLIAFGKRARLETSGLQRTLSAKSARVTAPLLGKSSGETRTGSLEEGSSAVVKAETLDQCLKASE